MSASNIPEKITPSTDGLERAFDERKEAHREEPVAPTEHHGDEVLNDGDEYHSVILSWNSYEDREHPYNLARWRINATATLLAMLAFLVPFSSGLL
jgi:hypothetical protein